MPQGKGRKGGARGDIHLDHARAVDETRAVGARRVAARGFVRGGGGGFVRRGCGGGGFVGFVTRLVGGHELVIGVPAKYGVG